MEVFVALLRGINVGGNSRLPMKDLRDLLERLGGVDVATYIQSGNAVFRHERSDVEALATRLSAAIRDQHGFEPRILMLTRQELEAAVASNPFPLAQDEPKSLHVFFLASKPESPNWAVLEKVRADRERYQLVGRYFYLHAPDGIGRSKLAARIEKALGVPVTARNWRTVEKLVAMAETC